MVVDISDMLVEDIEAVVTTDAATSPAAAAAVVTLTDRIPFDSREDDAVDRFVDVMDTKLSMRGEVTVSEVVMEGVVVVVLEVTEGLGVVDSEEVQVTETVAGGSVGVVVLERVVGKVVDGRSGVVALASGIEGLPSGSVTSVGVVAAALGLTESVHISVTAGGTVLEGEIVTLVESGTEFEIVGSVGVVVAMRVVGAVVDGAAAGAFVGVFVSPSCIWASSFSGVLRPDVVGGGPGLRTGFGSKAGFPADSCADTLGRI